MRKYTQSSEANSDRKKLLGRLRYARNLDTKEVLAETMEVSFMSDEQLIQQNGTVEDRSFAVPFFEDKYLVKLTGSSLAMLTSQQRPMLGSKVHLNDESSMMLKNVSVLEHVPPVDAESYKKNEI